MIGISLSESPVTNGETFTAVLSDTNGVLSATTSAAGGGGTITPSNGGKTLTISGTLAQVNADLSTLADHDTSTASDTITIDASDSNGGTAHRGVDRSDRQRAAGDHRADAGDGRGWQGGCDHRRQPDGERHHRRRDVHRHVADTNGLLSVTAAFATVSNNASKRDDLAVRWRAVSTALGTLSDTDGTAGSDTITVNASDSFGNAATQTTTAITVNAAPTITAPGAATVAQSQATAVSGVNVGETGNTSGETFTVVLSNTAGVLSATTGVAGGGGTVTASNGGKTLTIAGALSQVNADLSTLTDDEHRRRRIRSPSMPLTASATAQSRSPSQ